MYTKEFFFISLFLQIFEIVPYCLETMSFEPSTTYSGMVPSSGVKSSTVVGSMTECLDYCTLRGDDTSVIFDSSRGKCYCHNLPLPLIELVPQPAAVAVGAEVLPDGTVIQWIDNVIRESSHFENIVFGFGTKYPATRMIGEPDFYPDYGNTQSAWCPENLGKEFVELAIAEAVYIKEIHIYEVFNAGGVQMVSIRHGTDWIQIWSTQQPQRIQESRIFSPNFFPHNFMSDGVRIDLDLTITNAWSEFDAVRVIGTRTRSRR